jgi:hypothetical protein
MEVGRAEDREEGGVYDCPSDDEPERGRMPADNTAVIPAAFAGQGWSVGSG